MHRLYRLTTTLFAPLIAFYLALRKRKGKEDALRFAERLGFARAPRPNGKLVWLHGASVGEVLCVLSLIGKIRTLYPDWAILITSGTVTSAKLLDSRLPDGVIHHYMPVDRWPYVTRFLDHWKPDLTLWVESELWPNMLAALDERKIPTVLLNGRMSEKSYHRWRLIPSGARKLMQTFALGLAQTGAERARFEALGLADVRAIGNLKYAADPLPCDDAALDEMKAQIGSRPVWLMASTHPGEEAIALTCHAKLARAFPDLLTIIAPRHPARGDEIAALAVQEKLCLAQRSTGDRIGPQTQLYLADTMGELGLFYRLSPLTCLAGSFTWGGHNPVEPAQLGCAIIVGPRMDNFTVMADDLLGAGAALQVMDEAELTETLSHLLKTPQECAALGTKARNWTATKSGVLDETLRLLEPFFTKAESSP